MTIKERDMIRQSVCRVFLCLVFCLGTWVCRADASEKINRLIERAR